MTAIANQVLLPLCLALMMLVVGTGLRPASFKPLFLKPKATLIGLLAQLFLLPLIAWCLISLLGLPLPLAAGLLLLACAPGGATSNLFSHLARGDVPLSIALTACLSLLAPIWMPFAVKLQLSWLGYAAEFRLSYGQSVMQLLVVTVVPLLLGMLLQHFFSRWVQTYEKRLKQAATVTLLLMIGILIAVNQDAISKQATLQAAVIVLLLASLALLAGYWLARACGLTLAQARTLSFETGVQNAAVAMLVAFTQLHQFELGMIALLYGLLMNIPAFTTLWWFARTPSK